MTATALFLPFIDILLLWINQSTILKWIVVWSILPLLYAGQKFERPEKLDIHNFFQVITTRTGRVDKCLVVVKWLKRVHHNNSITTRKFFSAADLHYLYPCTKNDYEPDLSFFLFFCLLRSISRNEVPFWPMSYVS